MKMNQPLITIITPSFNRAGMIETAIQSVLEQHYPAIEHIIIDGGSTDGTLELLKKYSYLRVISEPDQGMYDALNKGLNLASGELIGFLNSDDRYALGCLQEAAEIISTHPEVDAVWGRADIIKKTDSKDELLVFRPPEEEKEIIPLLIFGLPIFNACFFRKSVFDRLGKFVPEIKISGDREFMLRAALGGCKFQVTDSILYHYLSHGDSLTFSSQNDLSEQWNQEQVEFSEFYLNDKTTPQKSKAVYRKMHSKSNMSLIKIALQRGSLVHAVRLALHGWRINPGWSLIFVENCLRHLSKNQQVDILKK
jgi:glycosyltransferase involved in cell wall biosynthesis